MLFFSQVIEPSWHAFLSTMSKVMNLDEVIKRHEDFVNAILEDTMLTNRSLFEKVTKLLSLCLKFCDKVLSAAKSTNTEKSTRATNALKHSMESLKNKFFKELVSFLMEVSHTVQNPSSQNSPSKVCNIIHR